MSELCFKPARELARLIAARKISAVEVVRAFIARIERVNPRLNAIVTFLPEQALAAAKKSVAALDTQRWQLPLGAADFAFQNGHMTEAKAWLDQALAVSQNTRTLWLKARMEAKEGNKAEAKKTVEAALAKATEADKNLADEIKRQAAAW